MGFVVWPGAGYPDDNKWWVTFRVKKPNSRKTGTETLSFRRKWQRDVFIEGLKQSPDRYDKVKFNED